MKISKSALDATIEEFTHLRVKDGEMVEVNSDAETKLISDFINSVIQAYSERLPDLVGAALAYKEAASMGWGVKKSKRLMKALDKADKALAVMED